MVPFAAELSLTDLIGSVSVENWNGLKYCLITRIEITINHKSSRAPLCHVFT